MALAMTDRLYELRRDSPEVDGDEENESALDGFFSTIEEMSRNIDEIESKMADIRRVQDDIITKPATANKSAKEQHSQLMEQVKVLSQKVHRGLKRLDEEIKKEELGPNRHTADFRIKKSQFATISSKLKRVMLEYNQLEENHREKCKNLIKRQLQTVDPSSEPSDDKVDELLESQDLSVFTQDILTQTAQKRQALNEVEARKQEIFQLEENIRELHDMFYDMMLLVESQGDLIDNIQHQVDNAAVFISKGTAETTKARVYSQRNRSLTWIICGVVTCVVIVLVVVVVLVIVIAVAIVFGNSSANVNVLSGGGGGGPGGGGG